MRSMEPGRLLAAWLWIGLTAAALAAAESPAEPAAVAAVETSAAAEPVDEHAGDEDDDLFGRSRHGDAFNEGPRQKAYLMDGAGVIRFPVASRQPEVQRFVEQGIGQLHGFWYFEAERSFRHAAMLDPDCAIAYWGMALANTNNNTRAKAFIAEAVARRSKASRRETMFIDALHDFLTGSGDNRQKAVRYVAALEKICSEFPDDLEAKAQLGYALYKHRSDVKRTPEQVDEALKQVLAIDPMHPVHHYRIHLWDSDKANLAVDSAALCGQSAPGIAHMWHMSGHTFSRLKRYADAAWQQEASARVDHAHMMRDRVLPDQIHNFAHNNEWLIRNLLHLGRFRDAVDLARNMTELPRHPKYNTLGRGSAQYGRQRLFDALVQYELWEDLIALAEGPALEPTDNETEQVKRLRHLGVAYAERSDTAGVARVVAELEQLRQRAQQALGKAKQEEANDPRLAEPKPPTPPAEAVEGELAAADEKAAEQADEKVEEQPAEPAEAKPAPPAPARGQRPTRARPSSGPADRLKSIEAALAAIEGRKLVVAGQYQEALPLLVKANEDKLVSARVRSLAGEHKAAADAVEGVVKGAANQVRPLAVQVEVLWRAERRDDAKKAFERLRQISNQVQVGSPVFERLAPIAHELGLPSDWRIVQPLAADVGQRPSLDSLGPFRWRPSPAPDWKLADHEGRQFALADYRGRPVVVVFYLGYGCLHCIEQLQALAPKARQFAYAGIDLVAISTDDASELRRSIEAYEGGMPFPIVSNASLDVFRAYRAYDDFESTPLHGAFLIDAAGLIRWHDIGHQPFMNIDFLLTESKRLLALPVAREQVEAPQVVERRRGIHPAGIGGALVLGGSDAPEAAFDSFFMLAQRERARLVLLRGGADDGVRAETRRLFERWEAQGAASFQAFQLTSRDDADQAHLADALRQATGVWLAGADADALLGALRDTAASGELAALLRRGGVLGATGPAAAVLTQWRQGVEAPLAGLELLPDVALDLAAASDSADAALPRVAAESGIEIELPPGATLVARGRRLFSLGETPVAVRLGATDSAPAVVQTLARRGDEADLTALRRQALDRLGPAFPAEALGPPVADNGSLVIVGGGGMPRGLIGRFVELAGGAEASIVVIPISTPDPLPPRDAMAEQLRRAGAKEVTVLTGRTPADVETPESLDALRRATGIWFGGGRQWRFIDAYEHTEAARLMHDVLRRGGVIGGSSAGASIQGDYLARGNPLGPADIMAPGYERGLGFLPGVAIDQHFSQRRRQDDLRSLIERHPQLLGVGVDEATALIVRGPIGEVLGEGRVHFLDRRPATAAHRNGDDFVSLAAGARYDLAAGRVLADE